MRAVTKGVLSKAYNDTATGADGWKYPEFKGYHAKTLWAHLQTAQGLFMMVTPDENLFLRLFTPRPGPDPRTATRNATVPFPTGDILFSHRRHFVLDGIAPIGNKFHRAAETGPEGEPNAAAGDYQHTVQYYFGTSGTAMPQ